MRVLVTGGAGFIGGNLGRRLVDRGHDVVVVDDLSTGHADQAVGDLVEGSILDDDVLDAGLSTGLSTGRGTGRGTGGTDAVVHLAAIGSVPKSVDDPARTNDVNVTGTLRVLEAARRHGVGHVVVASSAAVYGPNPPLPAHELVAVRPVSPYAVSKVATEQLALAWQATYGLGTLALRFFNVFGPLQGVDHDYAAVVPAFVDAALHDRPIPIHGTGEQTRDFVDVGTVAAVLTDAVERRITHDHPVNLAVGDRRSLLDVVAELEAILGRPLAREHQPSRAGDVPHSQADVSRLLGLFGSIERVPFADALRATVDWTASR